LSAVKETTALSAMVDEGKTLLEGRFKPDGYNASINVGNTAVQPVMHCTFNSFSGTRGDSANPRSGIHGVIVGKADYEGGG
jgi:diadenosine tetraphosphate (Ap4A) HIT family hydrolase